jgi:DUF1365 family protein
MDLDYEWRLSPPGRELTVHMENYRGRYKVFDATLRMRREEISTAALNRSLLRFPFMTLKVIGAIHLQALRLKLKGAIFHPHPDKSGRQEETRPR